MSYKWCAVPQCKNTSIKTPDKLFVTVPTDIKLRRKWFQLAHRDPKDVMESSKVFFCEDHFDMENDMANFMQFKMGYSERILMKKGVLPSKFHCQQDRCKRSIEIDSSGTRTVLVKRKKLQLIEELQQHSTNEAEVHEGVAVSQEQEPTDLRSTETEFRHDKETETVPIVTADKSVQVRIKTLFRSRGTQTTNKTRSIAVSPFKSPKAPSTSKMEPICKEKVMTDSETKHCDEEQSPTDNSSYDISSEKLSSPSSSSNVDSSVDTFKSDNLKNTMNVIYKKPLLYIGVSKECYFIIDLINKHTGIPVQHILLCLKKIRLNTTFAELEDNFSVSLSYGSKLFLKDVPIISSVLQPFIVKLDKCAVKKNLPLAFRNNYYDVSCIIDCLEIDIQKPSKAIHQALTWSDYKKGNTVKYLVSCTPNGLINYISPGFGGRTSDMAILENCSFLEQLERGTCILADRGFKNVEQLLNKAGVKLIRPQSVTAGVKLSRSEVRQTKIIASLRIHVERVIRRIREFHMLRQHSVINLNMLRILDHIMVIACALVNLQDSLIK